jgi:hypothetical protein
MSALAILIAFSPLSDLQAAMFINPGSQPGTENLACVVKAKQAKSKGAGTCGTHMYYSKKAHKCMDARAKK